MVESSREFHRLYVVLASDDPAWNSLVVDPGDLEPGDGISSESGLVDARKVLAQVPDCKQLILSVGRISQSHRVN